MLTTNEVVENTSDSIVALNADKELENCTYNIKNDKITCEFKDGVKYNVIIDTKIKKPCNITSETTFNKINLYGEDFDKNVQETEFLAYYEKDEKGKFTEFSITSKEFKIVTNDNCEFVAFISRVAIEPAK